MPFAGKKGVMSRLMSRVADTVMATPDDDTSSLNQANAIDLTPPQPPTIEHAYDVRQEQRKKSKDDNYSDSPSSFFGTVENGSQPARDKMKKNLGR